MFNLQVKISKRYLLKDVNWVRNMRILKGDVELPLTPVWSEEITSKHGRERYVSATSVCRRAQDEDSPR